MEIVEKKSSGAAASGEDAVKNWTIRTLMTDGSGSEESAPRDGQIIVVEVDGRLTLLWDYNGQLADYVPCSEEALRQVEAPTDVDLDHMEYHRFMTELKRMTTQGRIVSQMSLGKFIAMLEEGGHPFRDWVATTNGACDICSVSWETTQTFCHIGGSDIRRAYMVLLTLSMLCAVESTTNEGTVNWAYLDAAYQASQVLA